MLVSLHNGLRKYKEGLTKDDPITSITGSTFFLSIFCGKNFKIVMIECCVQDVVNWHPYEVLILPEGVAQPRDKALDQPHLASKQLNLDDDTIKLMGDWFRTRVPAACVTQRGLLGKGPKDFNILWECLIAARNHLEQSWLAREERDLVTEANEASDETEPHQGTDTIGFVRPLASFFGIFGF
ncbi:hypothetical protein NE237_027263 [Protea cynaroides]|uniref:Uncharacterized protein n=1 Tax=Protea cynaroides TaxID=273540 RepID=A0A9Q0JST6_9MAGN|nr:hypothetical protein NE237_027263 [Protea cynaroides]